MKRFFQNTFKVSLASLIATIIVTILFICILQVAGSDSPFIHMTGKIYIAIALPFLVLNPLFGFIYSFFMKGKIKILFILLHLACICTISFIAFISFMYRYFVPFAP